MNGQAEKAVEKELADGRHAVVVVGAYLEPDRWDIGGLLMDGDDYVDDGFHGCQFRLESGLARPEGGYYAIAVNITITGSKVFYENVGLSFLRTKMRCKIEYVGDCEPSTFDHGWVTVELQ